MLIQQSWPLFLMGAAGIAVLLLDLDKLRESAKAHGRPLPSSPVIQAAIVTLQPMLMLCLALWSGHELAGDLGLFSVLHGDPIGSSVQPISLILAIMGVALGSAVLIAYADPWFACWGRGDWEKLKPEGGREGRDLLRGILYGGITEEIIIRWGLMSAVGTLAIMLGFGHAAALAIAILLCALIFAAAHLPAVKMETPLTPMITLRTLILNFIPGIGFGVLFVLYGLEAAMVAHALVHAILYALPRARRNAST